MTASALNWEGAVGNRYVLLAIGTLIVFQMFFTYLPVMQTMFGTAALDLAAWVKIVIFGLLLMLIVEAEKLLLRRSTVSLER